MNKKVMRRMTVPAFLALGTLLVLLVVAGSTVCLIWLNPEIFISPMALEAFHIGYAMDRVIPFLVYVRGGVLVALGAWSELFLVCKLGMC